MTSRQLPPRFHTYLARRRRTRTVATLACVCLLISCVGAFAISTDADAFAAVSDHVASARAALTDDIGFARDAAHTQLAAAGASGFTQWIGELLFALFGNESEPSVPTPQSPTTPQPAQADQTTTSQLVNTPPPSKPVPVSAHPSKIREQSTQYPRYREYWNPSRHTRPHRNPSSNASSKPSAPSSKAA